MKNYIDYRTVTFDPLPASGYLSVEVFSFLNGHKWDEVALAYVQGLRPDGIRVTSGGISCDCRTNRVTIYVNNVQDLIITKIEQEMSVGLPDGVAHGQALRYALEFGIDSKECQQFNDRQEHDYFYCPHIPDTPPPSGFIK